MDIRCSTCGEPLDHDELHNMGVSYQMAKAAFIKYGCGAVDHFWNKKPLQVCQRKATPEGEVAALIYAGVGGDMDAAASMLADAEELGMI